MKFAISVVVNTKEDILIHSAFFVEAINKDEALGKGLRISLKVYPEKEGYTRHHIVCNFTDVCLEVDNCVLR